MAAVPYFEDLLAALVDWRRVCHRQSRVVVTTPAPGGITTAWVLGRAAAGEGVELVEPGGALADRARRAPVLVESGWDEERSLRHIAHLEPAVARHYSRKRVRRCLDS